ncbi:hypothetical protein KGA66_02380 [Actinocrinis puniceicyclus]|uniref:VOC domain-containing protein n=1 Tax=Actinocrinis puniceicyclus TaxID=977794 RepID=A0A8J7WIE4_9ACTN|nr:VOC family protein [Actinocrinis puniceicyclus]MBS2961878.1 hypothetical protein [Actinocrinis puniceicyclus]
MSAIRALHQLEAQEASITRFSTSQEAVASKNLAGPRPAEAAGSPSPLSVRGGRPASVPLRFAVIVCARSRLKAGADLKRHGAIRLSEAGVSVAAGDELTSSGNDYASDERRSAHSLGRDRFPARQPASQPASQPGRSAVGGRRSTPGVTARSALAMIVSIAALTVDCADAAAMGVFYRAAGGGEVTHSDADSCWVALGGLLLVFRAVPGYRPPTWPAPDVPVQMHFEFYVEDLDEAQDHLVGLGATVPAHQPHPEALRTLLDPAGHPFCIATRR